MPKKKRLESSKYVVKIAHLCPTLIEKIKEYIP